LIATVITARSDYAISVFEVEVGASVVVRKVGITFIKRLAELRNKVTELVAGKPVGKPKHKAEDEVEGEDEVASDERGTDPFPALKGEVCH
jgi:hypothetical protein